MPIQPQQGIPAQPQRPITQGDQVGGGIPPQAAQGIRRVVMAGMKVLYDKSTSSAVIDILRASADDPASALAEATAMIVLGIYEKAGGKIPKGFLIPAGQALMRMVADFAVRLGLFQVSPQIGKAATQAFIDRMMQAFGAPQQIPSGASQPAGIGVPARPGMAQQSRGLVGAAMQPIAAGG